MIDAQIDCESRLHGGRTRHKKPKKPPRPRFQRASTERADDLVCVVGEANAWPYRATELRTHHPDELVQWTACRLKTSETFDFVVAPKNPLAPSTAGYTRLSRELLEGAERWRSFWTDGARSCGTPTSFAPGVGTRLRCSG